MLLRLQIENLGLIESAELEPARGLTVFTGETGAGKTMLAQAIGLLAGGQPGSAPVGPFGEEAYVEAEFELPTGLLDDPALAAVADLRPEDEPTLVVARRLFASGRTRALVWGRSCARSDLEALGERLLELSSQHEAQRLGRPAVQLALLDGHAANGGRLRAMATAWESLRAARTELAEARGEAERAVRERDQLEALVERMSEAAIQPGERAALGAERGRLQHLDELVSAVAGAVELIAPDEGEGAQLLATRAAAEVEAAGAYDAALGPVAAEVRDASVRLQEAAADLRSALAGMEAEPGRLEEVEARLQLFADLEHRFGAPVEELAGQAEAASRALEAIDGADSAIALLEEAVRAAETAAGAAAAELREARGATAEEFARAVEAELTDLGMEDARLEVRLDPADLGPRGYDQCQVLIAANRGLEPAPIQAAASGGELSRIALAVRVVARAGGAPDTLLLDEVDAGVGGRTARAVGQKLQELAEHAQVISITHLPQIASLAEAHFRVEKAPGDPARTTVERLSGEAVTGEIARMLGGEENDQSVRKAARALRKTPQRA